MHVGNTTYAFNSYNLIWVESPSNYISKYCCLDAPKGIHIDIFSTLAITFSDIQYTFSHFFNELYRSQIINSAGNILRFNTWSVERKWANLEICSFCMKCGCGAMLRRGFKANPNSFVIEHNQLWNLIMVFAYYIVKTLWIINDFTVLYFFRPFIFYIPI